MNRADLGDFGAGASDAELAQALAAFGAWARRDFRFPTPSVEEVEAVLLTSSDDGILEVSSWWLPGLSNSGFRDSTAFAEAWRRMAKRREREGFRVEVGPGDPEDASWIARQLLHPSVGARSVYRRQDEPTWPVAWEWPLRLGVLGSARSARHKQLTEALAQVHHQNLWTSVDMHKPGAECELLLLPGDVRQALGDLLDAPHRPRADCVVVLGTGQVSEARSLALLDVLRREARTSGVALLPAGKHIESVLTELLRALSHDRTLDVAMFDAIRNARGMRDPSSPVPELTFSRALAINSSVRLTAARLAREFSSEVKSIPMVPTGLPAGAEIQSSALQAGPLLEMATRTDPVLGHYAKRLGDLVRDGRWMYESSDATALVDIRREVEGVAGRGHRPARMTTVALSPQPTAEADAREVLTQVLEVGSEDVKRQLQPDRAYRLRVRIDRPNEESVGTGTPFPSHELPPSESGHTLDVSFVPLTADANGAIAPAQQATVFLPPSGPSTVCEIAFSTHDIAAAFRARLLISYENRILQTLRLDAPLDRDAAPYALAVENIVQTGFHNLAYHQPFDAALVVNHSTEGDPGITALTGKKVSFVQPQGMAQAIQALQDALTDHTALQTTELDLHSQALTKLIYGLMQHGRLLYDYVEPLLGPLDHDAGRIQVVEARAGAAFPLEYLYPLEVPPAQPPMCPHAKDALTETPAAVSHQECPHRDAADHMCPLRFWGFRKEVERQPAGVVPSETAGDVTTLAVPSPLNRKLDLLTCAQVARSAKVQAVDYDLPSGLLKVLQDNCGTVHAPETWQQWKGSVQERSPGFLLLLSHTDRDLQSNLPALEISKDKLSVASIEASYVRGPQASAPVVFLLGCDTADPSLGFISFVERFKRKQAALVVGTLSTISARRAARFLAVALPLFKAAAGSGRTFGDVFLQVKRTALAEGDGFALTLVAYGDTSWQL